MKTRTLLYIPLMFLFVLSLGVLVQHGNSVSEGLYRVVNQNESVRIPFELNNGKVYGVLPEAAEAGIQIGDAVRAINGREIVDNSVWAEELSKVNVGEKVNYTIQRETADGRTINLVANVDGLPMLLSFSQLISSLAITFLFLLCLPAISFLLGFYVAFIRPQDAMAWILLFLLLGIGSISLESWREGTLPKFFQETFINQVGIWMLLFSIYFPERLDFDRRHPFVKWILLTPLILFGAANVFEQIGRFFGWRVLWEGINNITEPLDRISSVLTMMAMGIFFALLAIKSATLENKDSRRRLRILYVGTSAAMLPSLGIVIYRIATNNKGGFFEIVPFWMAIFALVALLLFPLTMAYVIVVQRAMDVSVVVRQGLQYALAKNGIKFLQAIFFVAVCLGTFWVIRNFEQNTSAQIGYILAGFSLIPLIDLIAKRLKIWIDRRFFREAYNAELILSELSEDVRTMVETKPLLETVSAKISESMHVPQITLLLRNGSDFQPAYALGYEHAPQVVLSENTQTIEKLRKNEPLIVYQDDADSWINEKSAVREREDLRELNSQLLLPFGAKNELSGVISLSPKLSEEPYSPNDLRLLKSVAAQTGLALENSRLTEAIVSEAAQRERLNTEIEIAREVQERLFPQELPRIEGLDYFGACRPALGVGGDYYDFIELPEGKFGIAIGDISGKGIGASLMMASLQASLRGQAIHFKSDLAGLMKQINSLVYEASTANRYATFFYAQYEPATRRLAYVNAGHNPPFLIRKNGEVLKLEVGGTVVGMLPPMLVNYNQGEIQLQPGDVLVGSTDGITEAMNPAEEEWGEDEMLAELTKITDKSAAQILPLIVAKADEFANGAKQHDDMTMIIVKVTEN